MATKRIPRPRDPITLAKLIGDIATGQVADAVNDGKDPAAVVRGRAGGKKGGDARSAAIEPERRAEIAKKAAKARWARDNND
jgi:hypothetical protein